MKSLHDRKIVFSLFGLVLGRLKNARVLIPIRDALDEMLVRESFFSDAPFLWIGVTLKYGIKNDLHFVFERINKKYGDLPITLELDMQILQWADQHNLDLLRDIFMIAGLEAVIQVGKKYKLPVEAFVQERAKYDTIPNTIEECEGYKNSF